MGIHKGQSLKDIKKTKRVEIRLTDEKSNILNHCSEKLNVSKSETLLIGLNLVSEMLQDNEQKTK